MIHFFRKSGLLILLVCAGITADAQILSFKSLCMELDALQKKLVPDKRVAISDISIKDTLKPVITLLGETNLPEVKKEIIRILEKRKITFYDSVSILPDLSLGEKTWALAGISVSNLRAQPYHASELISQVCLGTPMKVIDSKGKWYRVQTPEHYIGWMDSSELRRLSQNEMEEWKKSRRCIYNRLSGFVYNSPKAKGRTKSDLVMGDLLQVELSGGKFIKIRLPDGTTGYAKKDECLSFEKWSQSEPEVRQILIVAAQMMGFPYLWGGTSSKGMDCSGLVKIAYFSQGIILARDASQQARYGEAVDFRNQDNLQPGDLLFFGASVQKITHVGIYLGNGDYIHASGEVDVGSIIPGNPNFNPERNNVAACRVINSLNTEGIIRVRDHPWYTDEKADKYGH